MNGFAKWASAGLAALTLLFLPATASQGHEGSGRLAGKRSWYRVYYRCHNGPWQYYATYNGWDKAQEVVRYLQFEMEVEAYFRPI